MAKQRREPTRHRAVVPVANEQGFIMVMALMMLVVLSLMATAAMTVRNTELAIVRNTEIVLSNFFGVEAVTLEGATVLENLPDATLRNETAFPAWLKPNDPDVLPVIDLGISSQWSTAGGIDPQETVFKGGDRSITPSGYKDSGANDNIWYAAVQGNLAADADQYDICRGSDLSDPTKVEKCYSVYGMYDVKSGAGKAYPGRRMMMVGYKKTVVSN